MTKYNVGDRVRVRSDLVVGNYYEMENSVVDAAAFVSEMLSFLGKEVTIVAIDDNSYYISGDVQEWYWTDEMFEGLVNENTLNN